ncbi:hypothetical protein LCGC14_1035860 [marine sediment metagenome]|uniref:Uncharacterized protein n=1 Tax=marine sediment metagenome TaxID=412755 RepID=A0A0F9QBF3_9ZZZZ
MTTTQELEKASHALEVMVPVVMDTVGKARALAVIKDDESFKEADSFLAELKRVKNHLDKERKKYTDPLNEVKAQIMDVYNPKTKLLSEAEMILKGATRKWFIAEQDRKRNEEQKRREEDRKRQEDENLRKAADLEKHGNNKQAEAVMNQPIVDTKPKVQTSFDGAKSYGRKVWKCEIVNMHDFLKAIADGLVSPSFIEVKPYQMDRAASSMKGQVNWPGVRVVEDVVMGVRQ